MEQVPSDDSCVGYENDFDVILTGIIKVFSIKQVSWSKNH